MYRTFSSLLIALISTSTLYAKENSTNLKIVADGYSLETIETAKTVNGDPLFFDVGGVTFSDDGSVFVASRLHGVWKYKDNTWSLFADGLHDPQGIQMMSSDGRAVVVAQKPELTWIEDTDGDGVADLYRCINDDWRFAGNYCEYIHGPVKDKKGNFYVSANLAHISKWIDEKVPGIKSGDHMGTTLGYDGWALKFSSEGKLTPLASGLRSAAGIGMSLEEELFITDNQGEWVPTSTLYHIQEGRFYGHPSSLLDFPEYRTGKNKDLIYDPEHLKSKRTMPALWLPHGELVNSPSNPVFDTTKGKFGPFSDQIFIGCQTRSNIVRASLEKVQGEYQGAVFNFMDHLQSGCIRLAFSPSGELWVGQTGRGWKSKGPKEYGLQKVKYDGKNSPFEIKTINLTESGFRVHFTEEANLEELAAEHIKVAHWTYRYSEKYGSPKIDQKSEKVEIISKAEDNKSFEFKVPLQVERIYQITLNVKGANGKSPSVNSGYYTLNKLLK